MPVNYRNDLQGYLSLMLIIRDIMFNLQVVLKQGYMPVDKGKYFEVELLEKTKLKELEGELREAKKA